MLYQGSDLVSINIKELTSMGFVLTHEIHTHDSASILPIFIEIGSHPSLRKPSVYVWLSPITTDMNDYEVLYVGKAGYGTTRRFSQHRGGFRNSGPGTNCAFIREKIAAGRKICVFGKVADEIELFGVTISRYSTEEEALCKYLSPLWNRATFPGSSEATASRVKTAPNAKVISTLESAPDEDTALWFDELNPEKKEQFAKIVSYAEGVSILREMPQKVIGSYTHQPSGYNNIPMIVYGRFTKSGKVAPNGWFFRIPQPTGAKVALTLFIPECFAANNLNTATVGRHQITSHAFIYPLDVADFLLHPDQYVDWTKLNTRSARTA